MSTVNLTLFPGQNAVGVVDFNGIAEAGATDPVAGDIVHYMIFE